jgi:TldD protein
MISRSLMEEVINLATRHGADYAEVFLEQNIKNTIVYDNGFVDSALAGQDYGAGIRLFSGTNIAYTYTNNVTRENLLTITQKAAESLGACKRQSDITLTEGIAVNRHPILSVPSGVSNRKKINHLERIYRAAKDYSPEIIKVTVRHWEMDRRRTVATSDGTVWQDRSVYCRAFINTVASNGKEHQTGFYRPGRVMGMEFYEKVDVEEAARSASRTAVTLLHAGPAPSGVMPVVLSKGGGGLLVHEGIGHSLESSYIARGGAIFAGKIGQKVAHEKITLIDDGTLPNEWGSINVDDEGIAATRNVLIENGILKSYIVDRMGARKLGMEPTGCGRRESYRFAPVSRMTTTFFAPGPDTEEDIIKSIDYGFYAKEFGGGSGNPITSDFDFTVLEGYIIRNGQICEPCRSASLTGHAVDVLFEIDMVGNDQGPFPPGMCGAASGSLPVGNGTPTLRVRRMTVGGKK